MQDPSFHSLFTATFQGQVYPVVFAIDYSAGTVSFQDAPYHPSEIYTRSLSEVELTYVG